MAVCRSPEATRKWMRAYMFDTAEAASETFKDLQVHRSVQEVTVPVKFEQALDTVIEHFSHNTTHRIRHMDYLHLIPRQEIAGFVLPLSVVPRYLYQQHSVVPHRHVLGIHFLIISTPCASTTKLDMKRSKHKFCGSCLPLHRPTIQNS